MPDINRKNIIVCGYYYRQNLGDDLLLKVAKRIFANNTNNYSCRFLNTDDITEKDIVWANYIVIFGGEVLNDYFLNKFVYFKNLCLQKYNKHISLYAIGVSMNQDYEEIKYKLDIFDHITFRNKSDYDKISPRYEPKICSYLPDPVFLLSYKNNKPVINKSARPYIGYFLSQTAVVGQNETVASIEKYYDDIVKSIEYLIKYNYTIILFAMCCNDKPSQNDRLINNEIHKRIHPKYRQYVKLSDKVVENLPKMQMAVCWRFHAHVLCISNGIPFISISNTPKVNNLLKDYGLEALSYYNANFIAGVSYLLSKKQEISAVLSKLFIKTIKPAVAKYYDTRFIGSVSKNVSPIYLPQLTNELDEHIQTIITSTRVLDADVLLYKLLGVSHTEYAWGLSEKLNAMAGALNLKEELKWVLKEELKKGSLNKFIYSRILSGACSDRKYYRFDNKKFLNFYQFNQDDMAGCHRSGWQFVINNMEKSFGTIDPNAVICDLYLDRTFHWEHDLNHKLGIIPYRKPWIGFIHHTTSSYFNNNALELLKKPSFIESLKSCKGLFVLSHYLKNKIKKICESSGFNSPLIDVIYHPTELVDAIKQFNIEKFQNNREKKIVQIGSWMRNLNAIFELDLKQNSLGLQKTALVGTNMQNYYNDIINHSNSIKGNIVGGKERENHSNNEKKRFVKFIDDGNTQTSPKLMSNNINYLQNVELISKLDNDAYDEFLSKNIVFINLIDCSVANTIIECISRHTPIIVNRHPAIEEYLGKGYPLFYTNMLEASKLANDMEIIKKANHYLQKLDKSIININNFIYNFKNSRIIKNIIGQ